MSRFSLNWWRASVGASGKFTTYRPTPARKGLTLVALTLVCGWLLSSGLARVFNGAFLSPYDTLQLASVIASGEPLAPWVIANLWACLAGSAAVLLVLGASTLTRQAWEKLAHVMIPTALLISLYVGVSSIAFSLYTESAGFNSPALLWALATNDEVASLRWKAIAAFATAPFIAGLLALPLLKPRGLHGDARWASAWGAKKGGLFAKTGVVLAKWQGRLIIADRPGHVLGVAPTGAGKGVGWVIPTLLRWVGSAIVLDPKRENYEITAGHRRAMGQRVVLFDPFNPAGSPTRWNPLAFVAGSTQPIDEISKVAELLVPTPEQSDPHWTSSARSLFIGITLHLHTDKAPGASDITISQVLTFLLENNQASLLTLCSDHRDTMDQTAKRLLLVQANRPDKEAGSVHSTLHTAMAMWEIPSVCEATSANDIDLRELRTIPTTIYLAVPPDSIVRSARLLSLYWQQVMDAMTRSMPTKSEPHEVLMLMDEFTLPGKMALVKHGLGFLRGYQVTVFVVIQSINQLTEVYGDAGGRTIIDNCRFRAYMAPNDVRAAQAISDALGSTTVQVKSISVSGIKHTRSYSKQKRPLLLPQEIMTLGVDKLIVQVEGLSAIKGRKIRYYKERPWKALIKPPPHPGEIIATARKKPQPIFHGEFLVKGMRDLTNSLASEMDPEPGASLRAVGARLTVSAFD